MEKIIRLYKKDLNRCSENKDFDEITIYDFKSTSVTLIDIEEASIVIYNDGKMKKVLKDRGYG